MMGWPTLTGVGASVALMLAPMWAPSHATGLALMLAGLITLATIGKITTLKQRENV